MVFSKHVTYYISFIVWLAMIFTWQPPPPNGHIRHFDHANNSGLTSTHTGTMEDVQR
jgi:hypothetical protein